MARALSERLATATEGVPGRLAWEGDSEVCAWLAAAGSNSSMPNRQGLIIA